MRRSFSGWLGRHPWNKEIGDTLRNLYPAGMTPMERMEALAEMGIDPKDQMNPDTPYGRLYNSAMQPGNTLMQNALYNMTMGGLPFEPELAQDSKNFWAATIKDIMYGTNEARARVPTVNVDTGENIAVEDPRMFSDPLRDIIIENRKAAGLTERGQVPEEINRFLPPSAGDPTSPEAFEKGYGESFWDKTGDWAGMDTSDTQYTSEVARLLKSNPELKSNPGMLRAIARRNVAMRRGWRG